VIAEVEAAMSSDYTNAVWKTDSRAGDDSKLLPSHVEDYAQMAQMCLERMSRIWNEIELPRDKRRGELDDISHEVAHVWSMAIERAKRKKEECQQQIEDSVQEIYRIKEELGEFSRDSHRQGIEGVLKLEKIVGCSLQARYEAVQEILMQWKNQRAAREADFKSLQSQINNLRIRFGDVVIAPSLSPRKSDISLANLHRLTGDLEECKTEKLKRERELATLLSKLRSVCLQLGENDIDIAAMAHPSLKFYREALPDQFSLVRPSFSNQPGLQRNIRPEDVELDLSNETFVKLEAKIVDVFDWKASREKQVVEVADVLKNLWNVLGIPEDNLERGIHIRALEGPTRLHLQSIEKCKNEVRRLEKEKARQLWELIDSERETLERLCEETWLPMPKLCTLLTINNDDDGDGSSVGKISDALSKLTRMIDETRSLAEKREPILIQINEIERSRAEVAWLSEYEQDSDRYKGRDSTKKLNRALRAGRMRDKLPDMIKILRKAIVQWEQEERCPFVYGNQDYNVVLDNMEIELTATRQPPARNRARNNARGRTPSRAAYTPPPPQVLSPTPSTLDPHDDTGYVPSHLPQYSGSGPRNTTQRKKVIKRSLTPSLTRRLNLL